MQGTIICSHCLGTFQYRREELEKYNIRPKCPYCGTRLGKDDEEVAETGENNIYQSKVWESYFGNF